jgi:hypothetical protein
MGGMAGLQVCRFDIRRILLPHTGHLEGGISDCSDISNPLQLVGDRDVVRCVAGRM